MRKEFRSNYSKENLNNCNHRKYYKNVPDPFGIRLVLMCRSMCHFFIVSELYQVKESENKYPNQIHKVPVQTNFFHHFVTSPAFISSQNHVKEYDDIDEDP